MEWNIWIWSGNVLNTDWRRLREELYTGSAFQCDHWNSSCVEHQNPHLYRLWWSWGPTNSLTTSLWIQSTVLTWPNYIWPVWPRLKGTNAPLQSTMRNAIMTCEHFGNVWGWSSFRRGGGFVVTCPTRSGKEYTSLLRRDKLSPYAFMRRGLQDDCGDWRRLNVFWRVLIKISGVLRCESSQQLDIVWPSNDGYNICISWKWILTNIHHISKTSLFMNMWVILIYKRTWLMNKWGPNHIVLLLLKQGSGLLVAWTNS